MSAGGGMTDKLTEALEWYDEGGLLDGPAGVKAEDHLADLTEAARRWASFPTDEDVERAVLWVSRIHHGHSAMVPCIVCIEAARAALDAVKR